MRKAKYIQFTDRQNKPIAYLSRQSDKVKDAQIQRRLSEISTLEFTVPFIEEHTKNKILSLTPDSKIFVDQSDMEFVILQDGTVNPQMGDDGKSYATIVAKESQELLSKVYITARNDGLAKVDLLFYALSNPPAVKIPTNNPYDLGSAGHALYALLYYADWGNQQKWTLGTVDVDGKFDVETEKQSVLDNINKIKELWNGIIVYDSLNHIIHFRDPDKWQNYRGYQVRYGKNQRVVESPRSYNLITKLYPFGNDDLNIGTVNNNQIYLENYSYTATQYTQVLENPDIYEPAQLKEWALKQLGKYCKPRPTYRAEALDLQVLPEFEHEEFQLGDMVDVINEYLAISERLRLIEHAYQIFEPQQASVVIGYYEENLIDQISESVKSAKKVSRILTATGRISTRKSE